MAPLKFPRSVMCMTYVEYKMRNVLPNNCQPIIHSNRRQCVSLMVSRFSTSFPRIRIVRSFVPCVKRQPVINVGRDMYLRLCIRFYLRGMDIRFEIRSDRNENRPCRV